MLAAGALTLATPVRASVSAQDARPPRGPLLTGHDLATLGALSVAAGALVPFDTRIARWSQRPAQQRSPAVRGTAAVLRVLGSPGVFLVGAGTYGVGALTDQRATATVGLHAAAAVVAGSVVTTAIKLGVGRARPSVTGDSLATSVGFTRGFRRGNDYQSLPSGHSTAAFAFAGALAAEGRHRWPDVNRVTGPVGFAVAGLVAASRVYHDRHWASDVVLGAGIGATAGAVVVRYARSHPGNEADRRLLPRAAPPRPLVSWTVRF